MNLFIKLFQFELIINSHAVIRNKTEVLCTRDIDIIRIHHCTLLVCVFVYVWVCVGKNLEGYILSY